MQTASVQQIAYSKMSQIVEAGKASAARGIEALQKEWSIRQDYVVKPTAIVPEVVVGDRDAQDREVPSHLVMRIGGAPLALTSHSRGQLLERAGVAITPGLDFGGHHAARHARFSYANTLENLRAGVSRLRDYLTKI